MSNFTHTGIYYTTAHLHGVEPSWVTPAEPVGLDWRILDQLERSLKY